MKVNRNKEEQLFAPFDINILFESLEEVKALVDIVNLKASDIVAFTHGSSYSKLPISPETIASVKGAIYSTLEEYFVEKGFNNEV